MDKNPFIRSINNEPVYDPDSEKYKNFLLFSGTANLKLAQDVSKHLSKPLSQITSVKFADGECNIQIQESVRGKNVYIIQPTCKPVNDNLMELILTISAMKRAAAKKIIAVIPYFGYARADRKMLARVPISAADVAKILETFGINHVVAVDLHCGQIQGFFGPTISVDNLESQVFMVDYLLTSEEFKNKTNKICLVSPDVGGVYRVNSFEKKLKKHLLLKKGEIYDVSITMITKQRLKANEVEQMTLVGDVNGYDCIIIDDMIDTGGTLCLAAETLKKHGANKVYAFASHGLFNGNAFEKIEKSVLEKVIVTDTIPRNPDMEKYTKKIEYISIATLIAEAIRRIEKNECMSEIFI
jgi:ribose-phosphate pyrophosphokinase